MSDAARTPQIRILSSLDDVPAAAWNALAGKQPFVRHEFLSALEETGCVGAASGWFPQHLSAWSGDKLVGALPLYAKTHSYGEYVFDWAWAEAYERHGLAYYPKLVSAVPFSPIPGARLLTADASVRALLIDAAMQSEADISSLHVLFPGELEAEEWRSQGCLLRQGLQFHWRNSGYADFEDFLATLSSAKRGKIRQERRRVADAGVRLRWKCGPEIEAPDWEFFYRCYTRTYRAHRSTPYLNLEFFRRIGETMPAHLMLVVAEREGVPIAMALNLHDDTRLYGRYWGATEFVPALHFEACYYQAIEFCIARKLEWMEGGAQGEHKLARGFLPTKTWSAHHLRHPEFADAVERFLARETEGVEAYIDELHERAPFKRADDTI